jgi:ribosomal protein S13
MKELKESLTSEQVRDSENKNLINIIELKEYKEIKEEQKLPKRGRMGKDNLRAPPSTASARRAADSLQFEEVR